MQAVLIIMTWIQVGYGGMATSMQEFSSVERCEMARKAFNEQAAIWTQKEKFQAFCVPK